MIIFICSSILVGGCLIISLISCDLSIESIDHWSSFKSYGTDNFNLLNLLPFFSRFNLKKTKKFLLKTLFNDKNKNYVKSFSLILSLILELLKIYNTGLNIESLINIDFLKSIFFYFSIYPLTVFCFNSNYLTSWCEDVEPKCINPETIKEIKIKSIESQFLLSENNSPENPDTEMAEDEGNPTFSDVEMSEGSNSSDSNGDETPIYPEDNAQDELRSLIESGEVLLNGKQEDVKQLIENIVSANDETSRAILEDIYAEANSQTRSVLDTHYADHPRLSDIRQNVEAAEPEMLVAEETSDTNTTQNTETQPAQETQQGSTTPVD